MERFVIHGGMPLIGTAAVPAAKNAVVALMAASLLSGSVTELLNIERISDADDMLEILRSLGCDCAWQDSAVRIDSGAAEAPQVPSSRANKIRSSIFLLGPALARFRKATVARPGGCEIGLRPIDIHRKGLEALGVKITDEYGLLKCDAGGLHGGVVHLDCPSVGATENLMMVSVFTDGVTEIRNAAKEPEIVDLAGLINRAGGNITGAGTSTVVIRGVPKLNGCIYRPIPDRIVTGTLMIAVAITGGRIELTGAVPEHVSSLTVKLRDAGVSVQAVGDRITVECAGRSKSFFTVDTQPYPGFPTDLQAQTTALQAVSDGTCAVIENMFESRFKHIPELLKMGACITVRDRVAIVRGVPRLYGADVTAPDLRGGAALILAGLCAQGITTVNNIALVDRGYYQFEKTLRKLGADIEREVTNDR